MKTHLNITIDTNIYLKIKLNPKINMSNLVNEFLKSYFNDEEIKVEELSSQLADHKKKGILLEYEIEKKNATAEKEKQKLLTDIKDKKKKMLSNIPVGSDFYSKLTREKALKEMEGDEKDDTAHGRDL